MFRTTTQCTLARLCVLQSSWLMVRVQWITELTERRGFRAAQIGTYVWTQGHKFEQATINFIWLKERTFSEKQRNKDKKKNHGNRPARTQTLHAFTHREGSHRSLCPLRSFEKINNITLDFSLSFFVKWLLYVLSKENRASEVTGQKHLNKDTEYRKKLCAPTAMQFKK